MKITKASIGLILLFVSYCGFADNQLIIDQAGDNFVLGIEQTGNLNKTELSIFGNTNRLWAIQIGNNNTISWTDSEGSQIANGGDIAGDYNNLHLEQQCSDTVCLPNTIGMHISGSRNNIRWGQGVKLDNATDETFYWDGADQGGKTLLLDVHGDDNTVVGWQASGTGNGGSHTANLYLYSNKNTGYIEQRGNLDKLLNISTYNSDNEFGVIQQDTAAHQATITLTGSDPTILNLIQRGNTAQSYTLFQDCQTAGGCSVSITQE